MFAHTDTKQSPWRVVKADDKKCARLNCIRHLLSLVPYKDLTPTPPELPPRPAATELCPAAARGPDVRARDLVARRLKPGDKTGGRLSRICCFMEQIGNFPFSQTVLSPGCF